MTTIYSFAPIVDRHAEILILGSMPGRASLSANQYYAYPQNAFWRIMGELLDFNPAVASYTEKTAALKKAHIALWDVLQSCRRKGSLDSSIETQSQTINDFQSFFHQYRRIRYVFFNGGKAQTCFKRYVLNKDIPDSIRWLQLTRLPSTSPANATLSFARKREQWHQLLSGGLPVPYHSNEKISV
ncbi:DNA-deoxyinosine glycosylase [Nitrosomonas aestuarii]|uniref:DNA-deoxyinosine glycosylase n=1 Tax=Nitrosomonas aestuarii TaxID=52441 RepID=UPI000D324E55|nr:DNA-deoxyinosine glycosylase [Nitrosomonas aestuarii]PTN11967.1 G/U mismatch-specific uracil-DNA glycosylase [Nitrosomonas aestuarii]